MSPELRTPLNAVLGFSDLLADERYGPLNDRQQRHVSHIHTGGEHLFNRVSENLVLSKTQQGPMEPRPEDIQQPRAFAKAISAPSPLAEKNAQTFGQRVS